MTAYLPKIQNGRKRGKQSKCISFELGRTTGNYEGKTALRPRGMNIISGSHGNDMNDEATMLLEDSFCDTNGRNVMGKGDCSISDVLSENDLQTVDYLGQTSKVKGSTQMKSDEASKLRKLLRGKDCEISRLKEVIRKMSLDRESAVCSNDNSRMRIVELKNKLSGEYRKVEHVTTVERLRSKQKVSSDTERLRQERDEARAQLTQQEMLVWQLRKQVDQLGYVSQQRYKVIQELGKKMAAKDKSLQELRKRMEQAQLIQIGTGGSATDRRSSVATDTRHVAWETSSRLATVNEKVTKS